MQDMNPTVEFYQEQGDIRISSNDSNESYNEQYHGENPVKVNLIDLAIVTLGASISAARPIQRLSLHPLYAEEDATSAQAGAGNHHRREDSIRFKLDGTVVTDADGAAQRIICSSLQRACKHIRIVAEESKLEAEQSSHNIRDRAWSGLSPLTRRRLLTEEEEEHDEFLNGARQEIHTRLQQVTRKRHWSTRDALTDMLECHVTDELNHENIEHHISIFDVDARRVAVFIDPLDGTGCYAKGEYDAVTVLTAIVLDNKPIFGIICKPFAVDMNAELSSTRADHSFDFTHTFMNSGCFAVYGGILLHGAFVAGGEELEASRFFYLQEPIPRAVDLNARKAVISKSRSGGIVWKCIESLSSRGVLSSKPIHIAGAGYKALRLLLGAQQESLWFFPKPGTSLWDVAAADALLYVVGGRLTDKYSKPLDYSKARSEAENLDGIIASNNMALHELCMQLFHDEVWSDGDDE